MNNLKINNKKYIITLIALISFIILNIYISIRIYKGQSNNDILRLHVISNSNNIYDQIVKLRVNEKVQNYISDLNLNNLTNEEIINVLKSNANEILNITNSVLKDNDVDYTASVQIGKIMYDEKDSSLIHMDKGIFNSTKIILGNGDGKNIWSFICPNKENISKLKNYETIMPGISNIYNSDKHENTYRSKILEIFNNLK